MSKRMLLAVGIVSLCAGRLLAQDKPAQDNPADKLDALPDFKVEHVLRADPKVHGSWINLGHDNKGRLLLCGQRNQPVTRLTMQDGKIAREEVLKLPVTEIMGILYAFDSLYVNGFGKVDANPNGRSVFGLFRLKDSGNDQYDQVEFLREWNGGAGEHGAHGIVLGPDQMLYVVAGNFVNVPTDVLPSSPHRNYADDRILPRAEDGNGFGAGRKPPGGYIVRVDRDGKNAELVASGQRNDYDIAFNADGELFGWDSDMEWDWGTAWYRPIRVFHATSGADQGFREGSAKWPDYYPDSLPAITNIGIGSPVGVTFGYGAKFPSKYQKALFILDWTYGRVIAVHLTPKGSTYTATWENFVAPKGLKGGPKTPLNLTDAVIGEDGALYFTVGGRNTQASLYRVSYTGSASTAPVDAHDKEGADARAERHEIEAFHGKEIDSPAKLKRVYEALGSSDRNIRYAARIALERLPVEHWKKQILLDERPQAILTGLLALARVGTKEDQADVFNALFRLPANRMSEPLQLEKLRVIEVSIARHGKPAEVNAKSLITELNPLYPSKSSALNSELCQVLIAIEAPDAVAKTMDRIAAGPTLEEQIGYVHHLRTATRGWTPELRKTYFLWWTKDHSKAGHSEEVLKWFTDAGRGYSDGASMPKFLGNFHTQAKATLTADESLALADVLAAYIPPGQKPRPPAKKRPFVKEWKTEDLLPHLDEVAKERNFERGKEVFESAQCILCHKFGSDGGSVGAELTAVSSRFARKDILESIIEPSKVISEQYANTMIMLTNGKILDGRILEENAQRIVLQPNPLQPEKIEIKKSDIDKRALSKVSPMPAKLVDTFTKDEILDLLAYLESGGRKSHPAFATLLRAVDVTEKVASELKDNKLKIAASNELFGDPAPNMLKKLRVEYLEGEVARSMVVDENATLEIRASEGKKLTIKKALYGVLP
jgi:putative heme-binding domain-containing protein